MKKFLKYFLYSLVAFLLILYVTTINEGMEVFGISGYAEGIAKSFEYYLFWVLPYWWLILLFTAVLFAISTFSINKFITRPRR